MDIKDEKITIVTTTISLDKKEISLLRSILRKIEPYSLSSIEEYFRNDLLNMINLKDID